MGLGGRRGAAGVFAMAWPRRRSTFQDRVTIITGGARGLGLSLARRLAAEGARLILVSRHQDQLDNAVSDLTGQGGRAEAHVCDIRDRE